MGFLRVLTIILVVFLVGVNGQNNSFNNYYKYLWGNDHFIINPQGTQVQLKMDKTSGTYTFLRTVDLQSLIISRIILYMPFSYIHAGAGFRSKLQYGSGVFHIKMKIPNKKTGGIITSFFVTN